MLCNTTCYLSRQRCHLSARSRKLSGFVFRQLHVKAAGIWMPRFPLASTGLHTIPVPCWLFRRPALRLIVPVVRLQPPMLPSYRFRRAPKRLSTVTREQAVFIYCKVIMHFHYAVFERILTCKIILLLKAIRGHNYRIGYTPCNCRIESRKYY